MWIWEESGINLISIRSTEALYQSHLNSNNKKTVRTFTLMHCNNFSPTIYTNPIYSFMKHKPILAGIQLPVGFGCHHSAPLWFPLLPLVLDWYYNNQEAVYYLLIPPLWDYILARCVENLFLKASVSVLVRHMELQGPATQYPYRSSACAHSMHQQASTSHR